MELRVDPKFRDKIPPLTEEEFKQLEDNIVKDGEVYEPIIVWNGTIIDGHNRWKIIQKHPEIPYKVKEMDFPDEWAVFDWMYSKQLGRRNLTDEQRTYMIGKMYEARKHTEAFRGNQYTIKSGGAENLPNHSNNKTAYMIGEEVGVSHDTVKKAEKFAKGVEILQDISPVAAEKVLRGNTKATKAQIAALSGMDLESQQQAASEIVNAIQEGKKLSATTTRTKTPTLQALPTTELKSTQLPSDPFRYESSPYNLDDFIEEIRLQGDDFINNVRIHIETRFAQFDGEPARIRLGNILKAIQEELMILREDWK